MMGKHIFTIHIFYIWSLESLQQIMIFVLTYRESEELAEVEAELVRIFFPILPLVYT